MINFKKAIVIGPCGAGKSTFSRALRDITNYPLFYLDMLYWKENWIGTPREEFIKIQNDIMDSNKQWIIDGNYHSTMEIRVLKADIIFFLDYDINVCIEQEKMRRGKKREDLPSYLEEDVESDDLIDYIKNFPNEGKIEILNLMNKYQHKNWIIFKNHEDTKQYLESLKERE